MNGRLLCYVRGFTQLPQKRKAATYFEGPGGHGRPLLAGSYVTQRVRLAYSKPGTSTGLQQKDQCGIWWKLAKWFLKNHDFIHVNSTVAGKYYKYKPDDGHLRFLIRKILTTVDLQVTSILSI